MITFLSKFISSQRQINQRDEDDEQEQDEDDMDDQDHLEVFAPGQLKYKIQLVSILSRLFSSRRVFTHFPVPVPFPLPFQSNVSQTELTKSLLLSSMTWLPYASPSFSDPCHHHTHALFPVNQDNDLSYLVPHIARNTQRYHKLFSKAIDESIPEPSVDITDKSDILDVIKFQREARNDQNQENDQPVFPPNLLRR